MTTLQQAFEEASKLPKDEQEILATWLLEELASEHRWQEIFSRSSKHLSLLADEALAEHTDGRAQDLDPDRL